MKILTDLFLFWYWQGDHANRQNPLLKPKTYNFVDYKVKTRIIALS